GEKRSITVPVSGNFDRVKIEISSGLVNLDTQVDIYAAKIIAANENPVIEPPANLQFDADTELCGAYFEVTPPVAEDNCDIPSLTGIREDKKDLDDLYPVGTTKITWVAVDAEGNESTPVYQEI